MSEREYVNCRKLHHLRDEIRAEPAEAPKQRKKLKSTVREAVLAALVAVYPEAMTPAEVGRAVNVRNTSTVSIALAQLHEGGLVEVLDGERFRAKEALA